MKKFGLLPAVAILAIPMVLGGCAEDKYGIAALDEQAGSEDVRPGAEPFTFPKEINDSTLRLLVEDDGRKYFGAESADGKDACVAVYFVEGQPGTYSGCGAYFGAGERLTQFSGQDGRATILVQDNVDTKRLESEGFRRIHQNVYVSR
ncbi:hypothetical protein [Pseudarthrobacter sp. AB1]|uniref:hypothetical protein n=1 Tax=Pseudarthrobacter sp. AB1 TaxID=2138309 RepID=UPI00186B7F85|nr:hypothetical protein [Pseudarthrobacter sp. AB1]